MVATGYGRDRAGQARSRYGYARAVGLGRRRAPEARPTTTRMRHMDDPVETTAGREPPDGLVAFLQQWPWEWYGTLTFRQDVHPEAAGKQFRRFVMRLNRRLYGHHWRKHGRGIQWARVLEYQRRGALHYHVLLAGVSGQQPRDCAALWHTWAGFAKIEPIRDLTAVLRYVSKFILQGGELDLEPRMRPPQP
jgi:hypothetical protein